MNALSIRSLSVELGGRPVLRDISFDVAHGEVVALIGPNGSGKSTLIRTLCGLLKPSGGDIAVDHKSIGDFSARELATKVAVVPQDEPIAFDFTVREIVTMGRIPMSTGLFDTDEDRRAAHQAMEIAHCVTLADRPITEISGGEKQRALIARALAQGASIMLLDEPTSHLDARHQAEVVRIVRHLAAQGQAIIIALHDLNVAAHVADRVVLLHEGAVATVGAVAEVLNSDRLESVYGVEFDRFENGHVVVPRLMG